MLLPTLLGIVSFAFILFIINYIIKKSSLDGKEEILTYFKSGWRIFWLACFCIAILAILNIISYNEIPNSKLDRSGLDNKIKNTEEYFKKIKNSEKEDTTKKEIKGDLQ
jgi:hypothetical protein